jgi:hypothetical protein
MSDVVHDVLDFTNVVHAWQLSITHVFNVFRKELCEHETINVDEIIS